VLCAALRAQRGPSRSAGRSLRAQAQTKAGEVLPPSPGRVASQQVSCNAAKEFSNELDGMGNGVTWQRAGDPFQGRTTGSREATECLTSGVPQALIAAINGADCYGATRRVTVNRSL
jgi:hypothetical protein